MTYHRRWKIIFSVILGLFFANISCATNTNPNDPYETYNRHAYAFNSTMDKILFKPVATAYNWVLPIFVRRGINNFFNNLDEIPVIANDLLQVDMMYAGQDFWRLLLNTSVGIGGLIDVADYIGIAPHSNDLGLTLNKWGYQKTSFLVVPLLGPRTVRDSWGLLGDFTLFTVYPYMNSVALRNSLLGLWYVDLRAQALRFQSTIDVVSFDPYVFERDAYLQHRNAVIRKNNGESEDAVSASNGVTLIPDETVADKITTNKPKPGKQKQ